MLQLSLGDINVTMPRIGDRMKYKSNYENFKLKMTFIGIIFTGMCVPTLATSLPEPTSEVADAAFSFSATVGCYKSFLLCCFQHRGNSLHSRAWAEKRARIHRSPLP